LIDGLLIKWFLILIFKKKNIIIIIIVIVIIIMSLVLTKNSWSKLLTSIFANKVLQEWLRVYR